MNINCEFCELHDWEDNFEDFELGIRSELAIDNFYEMIESNKNYHNLRQSFIITRYKGNNGEINLIINYLNRIKDVKKDNEIICAPFSYSLPIYYCPFCGKELNKNGITFEEFKNHHYIYEVD